MLEKGLHRKFFDVFNFRHIINYAQVNDMRITKEPEERRNEILDIAGHFFIKKGYDSVTLSDIADEIGISKGTIYHYFKSKEELLDATIIRYVERLHDYCKLVVADKRLNAIEKIMHLADIDALTKDDEEIKRFFHTVHPGNADMKLKRMIKQITIVTPLLTQIIEQGIREKVMYTKHPADAAKLLIASEKMLFEGLMGYKPDELQKKLIAYVHYVEIILGMREGSLSPLVEKFVNLGAVLKM